MWRIEQPIHTPMTSATAVVCTRNRWPLLEACLASLAEQMLDALEVIVVDNGSTDQTPQNLERWRHVSPRRHVLTEPIAGLSRARNRGLEAARGEIVLFLDDDALPPVTWANRHVAAYEDETIVAAGGPITLTFPAGRPAWAGPCLDHWWSALNHGDALHAFRRPNSPYGANMSIRRCSALAVGGFNIRLGRVRGSLISSEEADLFDRLWNTGGVIRYLPEAPIFHQVSEDRLRRLWLLRRGWAQGRTNARREGVLAGPEFRKRFVEEIRLAFGGPVGPWRTMIESRHEPGAALNDLCRRAGHFAWSCEHAWQRTRALTGHRFVRGSDSQRESA